MFFVISGYLITGIMADKMEQGTFSFLDFYERRIRRILPALYVMLLVTVFFSFFSINNNVFKEYFQSLFATNLFASNMYFLREATDYFAPSHALLLHTWSLAIEEQFYFVVPWVLLGCFHFGKRALAFRVMFVLMLASLLAYFLLQSWHLNEQAFFILPTRMWELALGSVLALGAFVCPKHFAPWSALISFILCGLALYLGCDVQYVGFANLAMVGASVLMIYGGAAQRCVWLSTVFRKSNLNVFWFNLLLSLFMALSASGAVSFSGNVARHGAT